MSDRLSLSLWLRGGVTPQNQYRAFEKLLRAFPFSKLSTGGTTLLIMAVDWSEPPIAEYPLVPVPDAEEVIRLAKEFKEPDTALQLDAYWDLWGLLDGDWKLLPAPVSILSFGPGFERESDEDFRIDFGTETRFLPQDGAAGLRMVQANIKSLLRLVHELDDILPVEKRVLSTESHVNFAERLQDVLAAL
ncbi:MAG TPA: hypothetical protein VGL53_31970 [Bryobacteraceae bacterium]|jgi:hypothetical protein